MEAMMLRSGDFLLKVGMGRAVLSGLLLAVAQAGAVQAQPLDSANAPPAPRHRPAGLLNENNLTSTGQTVPRPGVSQGAPQSGLDRDIEQEDDLVEQSICSSCN
jgi:hypothetical protein